MTTEIEELYERGLEEAVDLADVIWRAEFRQTAPDWKPLDTLSGVISQIDNMYAGIRMQRDNAMDWATEQHKAADEYAARIERLTSENEALTQALSGLMSALEREGEHGPSGGSLGCSVCGSMAEALAALSKKGKGE